MTGDYSGYFKPSATHVTGHIGSNDVLCHYGAFGSKMYIFVVGESIHMHLGVKIYNISLKWAEV